MAGRVEYKVCLSQRKIGTLTLFSSCLKCASNLLALGSKVASPRKGERLLQVLQGTILFILFKLSLNLTEMHASLKNEAEMKNTGLLHETVYEC